MKDPSAPSGLAWFLIALFFGFAMMGCMGHRPFPERDDFIVKLYPSRGKCWHWDSIEREIVGHTLCNERRKINGFSMVCTRKLGHRRAHHMHGAEDCYWIF